MKIKFLGKVYDTVKANCPFNVYPHGSDEYLVGTEISFDDDHLGFVAPDGIGKTPQAAVRDLEQKLDQIFRKLGATLGYEVTP